MLFLHSWFILDSGQLVYSILDTPKAGCLLFRDSQGNPTDHLGLRLQLRDFACEELARDEIGDEDRELFVSAQQLCQYLAAVETKVRQLGSLGKHSIAPGLKKRKRSEHLQKRSLPMMKRGMLSKGREQRSV